VRVDEIRSLFIFVLTPGGIVVAVRVSRRYGQWHVGAFW
jgi:hypothetical protein